ncbi:MAG TPA: DNA double-strand break repair nuclease NurA [Blastocatellia bacterium]|jgi:hypothetical protein
MIFRDKIQAALERRRVEFADFQNDLRLQYDIYSSALNELSRMSATKLADSLEGEASPGALPTGELDAGHLIIRFEEEWENREEARAWAFETLLGRRTFSADGSQILPSRDYSVPVAAVQVGWFDNPHTPDGRYIKDAAFEVLAPAEIMVRTGAATELSEQVVHGRRYALEVGALRSFMRGAAASGIDPERPPVVFFDSLLVISFADLLPDDQREFYTSEIIALLEASKETGIPIVGFVDTSFARDLVNMLQVAFALDDAQRINDAGLLAPRMKWGDRTAFLLCARRGILDHYGEAWRRAIGFTYLKTSADNPPARLDIPSWVHDRGLLDYVLDTVRGEVVVGNGYPYVIEAADQTAVLSGRDRELFYAVFQEFAERESLNLRVARKAISKAHRR